MEARYPSPMPGGAYFCRAEWPPSTSGATFFPGILLGPCGTRHCKYELYRAHSPIAWMTNIQRPLPTVSEPEPTAVEDDVVDLRAAAMAENLMTINKALKDLEIGGDNNIFG